MRWLFFMVAPTGTIAQVKETPKSQRINVLLSDDDRGVRKIVRAVLRSHPDIVIIAEAGNGRDAVILTKTHRPDVVVMDIEMPVLNGIDATAEILAAAPQTKVIIFSANAAQTDIDRAFAVGAVGYVAKHDAAALVAAIRSASLTT